MTCMDADFPEVELDNSIRFSTLSRMSYMSYEGSYNIVPTQMGPPARLLHQFGYFHQYTSA